MDRYGYTAPARVNVLVVPVNDTLEDDFVRYLAQLRPCHEIRLGDVLVASSLHYFHPQGSPHGRVMFNMVTLAVDEELLFLHDFEPFRKTFVVLGVGRYSSDHAPSTTLDRLKKRYPGIPVHNLVLFDSPTQSFDLLVFQLTDHEPLTSVMLVMNDVALNFLHALDSYALSFANITLRSPVLIKNSHTLTKTINHAHKRVSSGFKPPTLSEPSKLKLTAKHNGRQAKLMGNFFLLAGRYQDALASFTDALTHLKKCDDFLWFGLALEGVGIACVLLQYVHQPYQLQKNVICSVLHISHRRFPSISSTTHTTPLSPQPEQPQVSRSGLVDLLLVTTLPRVSISLTLSFNAADLQLMALPEVIKLVLAKVIHFYHLSINEHDENVVPDVVYVDLILRTIKFMLAVYLGGNDVNPDVLEAIVCLRQIKPKPQPTTTSYFSRSDILHHIEGVFSLLIADVHLVDQCRIYLVLALMYTDLGLKRKRAFILRILLARLLLELETRPEDDLGPLLLAQSLHQIFKFLFDTYAIPYEEKGTPKSWAPLQIPLLKLGLRIGEATNDYDFSLRLCNLLLSKFTHCLGEEDQASIKDKVARVVSTHPDMMTDYWDPFLVRGAHLVANGSDDLVPSPELLRQGLVGSAPANLTPAPSKTPEPFFDPYAKKDPVKRADPVLIKDEVYQLRVELQNPFTFPIDVNDVTIVTDEPGTVKTVGTSVAPPAPGTVVNGNKPPHVPMTSSMGAKVRPPPQISAKLLRLVSTLSIASDEVPQLSPTPALVVPPQSTETFEVSFVPQTTGKVVVTGISVRVGDCKSQQFAIGYPKNVELTFKVVPPQPKLLLTNMLVVNGLLMLMEGERSQFKVHLSNYSQEVVNYLLFSFWDLTIEPLTAHLEQQGTQLPALEVYELEWLLLKQGGFRIVNKDEIIANHQTIEPGEQVEVQVEVVGKKNMRKARIILEYANKDGGEASLLRYVTVPLSVLVVPLVEIYSCDVLPLFRGAFQHYQGGFGQLDHILQFLKDNPTIDSSEYCIFVADIRNPLGERLEATFHCQSQVGVVSLEPYKSWRFMFPVKKIDANALDTNATIPSLRNKQFVKNYNMTDDEERRMRYVFWVRQSFLAQISGQWRVTLSPRLGLMDPRQIRLTPRMVDTLVRQPFKVELAIADGDTNISVDRHGVNEYHLELDKFYVVRAVVVNRSDTTIKGILRHTPQEGTGVRASDRRILINGVLQQPLGPQGVAPGQSLTLDLGFLILERGEYLWHLVLDLVGHEPVVSYGVSVVAK